jgi:hypothetical protein
MSTTLEKTIVIRFLGGAHAHLGHVNRSFPGGPRAVSLCGKTGRISLQLPSTFWVDTPDSDDLCTFCLNAN